MTVQAEIAYAAQMNVRPRYHANDASLDVLDIDLQLMDIVDGRLLQPTMAEHGFALYSHVSQVADFTDLLANGEAHSAEIHSLIRQISGADDVAVTGPGVLRFGEKSVQSGAHNNSRPARFAHVDISDTTAQEFAARSNPRETPWRRYTQFNIWRSFSGPPQDVPLTLCDARSVAEHDLIRADAMFDVDGKIVWSFEGYVVAHNPNHRWVYWPNMTRDEVLIFTAYDSEMGGHAVPHVAFDDPSCSLETHPRASIEMRAIAFWY